VSNIVLLRCHHCDHTWDYGGRNQYYTTCPKCRFKVKIPANKAKDIIRRYPPEPKAKVQRKVKLLGIAAIVKKAVEEYGYDEETLIQVLLRLQREFGWLTRGMLSEVSKQLGVPLSRVYQAATFYKAFSLGPRGRHLIRVCMGTSCKVRGAPVILDRVKRILGVERGETTPDGRFSLETVNCVGCCALGPMMTVDENYHGNLKLIDVERILSGYG